MGVVSKLQFGQFTASDAYMVSPAINAPGFLLGVSTYHKTLTMLVGYYEPSHRTEVAAFLDFMARELNSL